MNDTKPGSQIYRDYIESQILSAGPIEIVHMLYRVAIDNLNLAAGCLKSGDIFGRSKAISKAQSAVHELMLALDPKVSASMTRNLAELYDYVQRRIIAAHTRRSEQALKDALKVLITLSEGWAGVRSKSQIASEEQSPAEPEATLSHLYSEPPRSPSPARDWSC
ncbi:MAG TPA: flagellar export chaperone FliS [Bryobacteraceae bacterium]|jgi:flagellar protein FliS